MASCDLSQPAVWEAFNAITTGGSTDWLILGYHGTRDRLSLVATGEGGVEELKTRLMPSENDFGLSEIHFGFLRIEGRVLLWTLLPEDAGGVRRARALVHSRAVGAAFRAHNAVLQASKPSDLNLSIIRHKLKLDGSLSVPSSPLPPPSPHDASDNRPPPPEKAHPLASAMAGLGIGGAPTAGSSYSQRSASDTGSSMRQQQLHGPPRQTNHSPPPPHQQLYDTPSYPSSAPRSRASSPLLVASNAADTLSTSSAAQPDAPLPRSESFPLPASPHLEEDWREQRRVVSDNYAQVEAQAAAAAQREREEREALEVERQNQESKECEEASRLDREKKERVAVEQAKENAEKEARARWESEQKERERLDLEERKRLEEEEMERREAADRLKREETRRAEAVVKERQRVEEERIAKEEEQRARAAEEEIRLLVEHERVEKKLREEEEIRKKEEERAKGREDLRLRWTSQKEGEVMLKGSVTCQHTSVMWRRRWFELRSDSLMLFKSEKDTARAVDIVKLQDLVKSIVTDPEEAEGIPHSFVLNFKAEADDSYFFYTDEKEDKELLITGLRMAANL